MVLSFAPFLLQANLINVCEVGIPDGYHSLEILDEPTLKLLTPCMFCLYTYVLMISPAYIIIVLLDI